jgi:hypothetical protein
MDRKKLGKISRDLMAMRDAPQKARVLEGIAKKLGRTLSKRGKEPNWVSEQFPNLRPISIPHHGGRDLSQGVRNSILNLLDDDVLEWDQWISQQERTRGQNDQN